MCVYLVDKENLCVFIVPVSLSMVKSTVYFEYSANIKRHVFNSRKYFHAKSHASEGMNERTNEEVERDRQRNDDDD